MAQNLRSGGDLVFSEALYILVAAAGRPDAHERVRKATLRAEQIGGAPAGRPARGHAAVGAALGRARPGRGPDAAAFFSDPANYSGKAAEKARAVAGAVEAYRAGDAHGARPVSAEAAAPVAAADRPVDKILILDFGSQSTQLIGRRDPPARRLQRDRSRRPARSSSCPLDGARGIILSGSPSVGVRAWRPGGRPAHLRAGAPRARASATACSGMSVDHGGEVEPLGHKEYGRARVRLLEARRRSSPGCPADSFVSWMSHGDTVTARPGRVPSSSRTRRAGCPRRSPTRRDGSGACSSTPRSATASTAWRCWRRSSSTSAGPGGSGTWSVPAARDARSSPAARGRAQRGAPHLGRRGFLRRGARCS